MTDDLCRLAPDLKYIADCNHVVWKTVLPFQFSSNCEIENQFLILLKAECFRENTQTEISDLLKDTQSVLERFEVLIKGIVSFNSSASKKYRFLEKNYRMLNQTARCGAEFVHQDLLKSIPNIAIGAYQFLDLNRGMTRSSLEQYAHRQGTIKISNGIYGTKLQFKGENYLILNAFHPEQVERMNAPKGAFLALACQTSTCYKKLAVEMVGNIDPALAVQGSLRNHMFKNRVKYGLDDVSILQNGFHISPSSLEAIFMFEYLFSFDQHTSFQLMRTNLAKNLAKNGFNLVDLRCLSENPYIKPMQGLGYYLFEKIEGLDMQSLCAEICGIREYLSAGVADSGDESETKTLESSFNF